MHILLMSRLLRAVRSVKTWDKPLQELVKKVTKQLLPSAAFYTFLAHKTHQSASGIL